MGKFAEVLLTEALIILPIILGDRFHGHESYKQYYDMRVNGGRSKHLTTASYEVPKESYYDRNGDNSIHASEDHIGSSDVWQVRNGGDNYAEVTRCDHMRQTYCEDVPNYPQNFVKQMLITNSSLLNYAHNDIIALTPRFDNQEELLCLAKEKLVSPKTAVNQNDQWRYILQSGEPEFHQRLRIETCLELDAKCKIIDGFAEGYVTSCNQKYIYRELIAIDETGKVIRDWFRIPASCCCHIRFKAGEGMGNILGPRFKRHTYKNV